MNVKQSSADNVWKLICHLIFPKILKIFTKKSLQLRVIKRAEGYDVYFQTGTDEHGQKIQEKAEKDDRYFTERIL